MVSCVVLGRFEGFSVQQPTALQLKLTRQATFPNARHDLSRILPENSHFCKSPARQLRRRGSQDVWAHLCRKSRHSVDSNLWKILAENQVSYKFKFQTTLCAQVLTRFQFHSVVSTVLALPPVTVDFQAQTSRPTGY